MTTPATPKPSEPKTVTDTRVYVRNNCVLGYQAVAQQESLIGTFIPVLLDKAYSGIVAAFRKAGEDTVVKKFGTRPFYLYEAGKTAPAALKLSGAFGCMILIDGDFAAKTPEDEPGSETTVSTAPPPEVTQPDKEDLRIAQLQKFKIPIKKVNVLYEARIVPADDATAVLYESRFLVVNQFLGAAGKEARGLVVNLNLIGAGSKPDEPVISSAILNLGEVAPGTVLGPDDLSTSRSHWAGGIGVSKESEDAFKVLAGTKTHFMPTTALAGFAETKKGNAVAKFIADVLDGTKTDVLKLANDQINPDARKAAAETAATDKEKAQVAEESAYKDLLTAKDNREKEGDAKGAHKDFLEFEVARTQRLWCSAYADARKVAKVPERAAASDCK